MQAASMNSEKPSFTARKEMGTSIPQPLEELTLVNNLNELGSRFFPRISKHELSLVQILVLANETLSENHARCLPYRTESYYVALSH